MVSQILNADIEISDFLETVTLTTRHDIHVMETSNF